MNTMVKITCSMQIKEKNIGNQAKAIDPENNPQDPKYNLKIVSTIQNDQVTYNFENFDKISTLRLTLEDLLNHLSLSKDISSNLLKSREKEEKE